jgi:hypothetical protein
MSKNEPGNRGEIFLRTPRKPQLHVPPVLPHSLAQNPRLFLDSATFAAVAECGRQSW